MHSFYSQLTVSPIKILPGWGKSDWQVHYPLALSLYVELVPVSQASLLLVERIPASRVCLWTGVAGIVGSTGQTTQRETQTRLCDWFKPWVQTISMVLGSFALHLPPSRMFFATISALGVKLKCNRGKLKWAIKSLSSDFNSPQQLYLRGLA